MKQSYSFQLVKSRLFPLSSLMKRIEYLIELLPRIRYKVKIDPVQEIAVLNEKKGQFKSLGHSPRFELLTESEYKGGWYYFEAALTNNNGNREANLYAVDRHGHESVIPIPSNLRGSVREVIFIPHKTIALFWSPTASFGFFSQSAILLHKITWLESYLRRAFRIFFDYVRFKDKHTLKNTLQVILDFLTNLQKAYKNTANDRISRVVGNDYQAFIKKYGRLSKKQLRKIKREISDWDPQQIFSLILSADEYADGDLEKTIASLQSQFYPHWEFFILIDFDRFESQKMDELKRMIRNETRIKLLRVTSSQDYAQRLNTGLDQCNGEYVVFIQKRDVLHRNALYRVMQNVILDPDIKMIYSDSDFMDENGNRQEPCFKPDWNPDLFYSTDYIGRSCFYTTKSVREVQGFKSGYDGAEEYELALRLISSLKKEEIAHIPKVLYHQFRPKMEKSLVLILLVFKHI